jgi:predicted dehydrogenase
MSTRLVERIRMRSALICAVCALLAVPAPAFVAGRQAPPPAPLKLAIAGLVHGHVEGFLQAAQGRQDLQIVGIFEPDTALQRSYGTRFHLDQALFFTDLGTMLDRAKPEAVASFTSTYDHPMVVEAAATRHIDVMMEKPLAVSVDHAGRIQRAAAAGGIQVLVNYETTWYPSHAAMWALLKEQHTGGEIRKMVAHDGHRGPQEIGVPPEFFGWLTDPVKNGAGALFDFGCYGANLMTWMMGNQRPLSVVAVTQQFKPAIYAKVDDEATIILQYPAAQGIIQASWNWPFDRKDFEVYAEHAQAVASRTSLRVRTGTGDEHAASTEPLGAGNEDSISHLLAVVRRTRKPNALSSLENNLIVTEILQAARESARSGAAVRLAAKPQGSGQ